MTALTASPSARAASRSSALLRSPTLRYALARIGQAILAAFLVYVVVFVIVTVLPGNPVEARLRSPELGYTEEEVQRLLAYYHLDQPVWTQLGFALQRIILHGDWGISLEGGRSVWSVVWEGFPATLQLASAAFGIALVLAFLIALGATFLPTRWGGGLLRSFPSLFLSLPNFLIGLVLINVFSFGLNWFSIIDYNSSSALVYAALTLAIPVSSPIAQIFITALDEARSQPYATVAVSKGISRPRLFLSHLLPNAALPTLTITAVIVGDLLGGSMITEAVFGRTGIGTVIASAATTQDVPVLQAAVTLTAVIFLTVNLITDLVYPLLDPRLRRRTAARRASVRKEVSA